MKRIWPLPEIQLISLAEHKEDRPVAVVTTFPAWEIVRSQVAFKAKSVISIQSATQEHWNELVGAVDGEVIYAIGGGLAADAAKYLAVQRNLPLLCVPTALSVDAIFAWSSAIRLEGCVKYIETTIPQKLIVDFQLIAAAPPSIRAAGICDVLSIATGSWDWKFAEDKGKNPDGMGYIPYVDDMAQAILRGVVDCAESAGAGEERGLRQLLDCIALETQLLNQVGHARPEEGSEHYFAYAIENWIGAGKPHAELVCPGTLIMAALQGQDIRPLKKAMQACHIRLNSIDPQIIRNTLQQLPKYCEKNKLPYGIAHDLDENKISKLDLNDILWS